jgi:hypothetical protein
LHALDPLYKARLQRSGKHHDAVFVPFGRADDNLRPTLVDISDAQRAASLTRMPVPYINSIISRDMRVGSTAA